MKNLLIACLLVCFSMSHAQNITRIEYFIDKDPGFGKGTAIALTPTANVSNLNSTVDITGLPQGVHYLYIRSKDASGAWSITGRSIFFNVKYATTSPTNITRIEYFLDTDPGFGKGTQVSFTASPNIANKTFNIDVTSVPTGSHNLYVRTKDGNGAWSMTSISTFTKTSVNGLFEVSETSAFDIYPNPSNGILNIKLTGNNKEGEFELMNASGQIVKTFPSKEEQISLTEFPSGSYFVKYRREGMVYYKKVMKE